MQVSNNTIHEFLSRLKVYFQENNQTNNYVKEEPPLRAELFNIEQMKQHGKELANFHKLSEQQNPDWLLKRLADNEKLLNRVRNLLVDAVKENSFVSPAGEWLLDNFYLIEEQIRTGKRHLPKRYSEGLPQLQNGHSAGLPRVYDMALEMLLHSDGRIDMEILNSFISAYQAVSELRLGELWAIPIMLRLALIENLRRVAARIAVDRINQNLAGYWASLMIETAEKDPKSLIMVIADMARSNPPMESSFIAELSRQLLWKGPDLALPLTWVEQRLSEIGLTSNDLVNIDNQNQAASQVSISNSIGSLRFLSTVDWREFVEAASVVEQELHNDIDGQYIKMDFFTRDSYRHVIENIAKYSDHSEKEVAHKAIELAKKNWEQAKAEPFTTHVGYYLLDKGVNELEQWAKVKFPLSEKFLKTIKKRSLLFYLGPILMITSVITFWLFTKAEHLPLWQQILFLVLLLFSSSQFAVTITNWLFTLIAKPCVLPRMNFSDGIPEEYSTLVVMPTMLTSAYIVDVLIERLEVHFLANRYDNLFFALLTDFADAKTEKLPYDEPLLQLAKKRIEELNSKYKKEKDIFFLFHRPRKWNPVDKIWMGYERKRGKLADLNALLREHVNDRFSFIAGDVASLPTIKYIITLDTDTQMSRDAAWKMIGAMAHPLNHPFYDEHKLRVTKGYGILQPRVSISLPQSDTSLYEKLFAGESGVDPYTRLTSDLYQDMFAEGSFIGKGIYDIDAFERALKNRFPENRILSHDLLESCYARSGLLSDVELYEVYPSMYSADVNRRHRWIRGDWQIASWILPYVPGGDKKAHKNTLSALSRWKIFDNLRRSIAVISLAILLIFAWVVFHFPLFWTAVVIGLFVLPSVISTLLPVMISTLKTLINRTDDIKLWHHIYFAIRPLGDSLVQASFTFICLPYEAYFTLHAIIRTSWRMMVSHKRLLEWNPSANLESTSDRTLKNAYKSMWAAPVLSLLIIAYLCVYNPVTLLIIWPVLSIWLVSPAIAWWVSHPLPESQTELAPDQLIYLRKLSRKTWSFFENIVGPEDNWLPPDNYQQNPGDIIAHRTSPTNIGLSLLANLTAFDFGYISLQQLVTRTAHTMNTMSTMEKYNGHFYNWYETTSLTPLHPRYISTVDSGNLVAHLLTLRQGLLSLPDQKILHPGVFKGIHDTFMILEDHQPQADLSAFKAMIQSAETIPPATLGACKILLEQCIGTATTILNELDNNPKAETYNWAQLLLKQCNDAYETVQLFAPWIFITDLPAAFSELYKLNDIPSVIEAKNIIHSVLHELGKKQQTEALNVLNTKLEQALASIKEWEDANRNIIDLCSTFSNVSYEFLYDRPKHLFTIGYNVDENRRDAGYYDLLASEARLGIFTAIAQGKIPQDSWFALGRLLTNNNSGPVLLSWSGSMFEYLMPNLIMPEYENTLLYQTSKATVKRQIEYAGQLGVPWGMSESGYNMVDASLNYQYRAFGVPNLGLKRGLAEDTVIAPYASALALMVMPEEACKNLQHMSALGFEGRYGFYEAIDYTPARLPRGQSNVVIQSFMAHHQGMSFLSYAYLLLDRPMHKRFEDEPQFQATLLLLQERVPKTSAFYSHTADVAEYNPAVVNTEIRTIRTPDTAIPEIQLLSNGRYHVMISNAGAGYSRWKDLAVSRWREDVTCDNLGVFCYIRDLDTKEFWSATHQPALKKAKTYEATFTQGRAEFRRKDDNIDTYTEIVVSPEDDIEIRRVHITNHTRRSRVIEVTSYAEVVLNMQPADVIHRSFSNLFIQTELLTAKHAILCNRRKRSVEEQSPWLFHLMTVHADNFSEASYETDRSIFIGRGNTLADPAAMHTDGDLSGTAGPVLDPVVAIRYQITLEPEETATVDMILGMSDTKDACTSLIEKYQDKHNKDRVFELAWTHSQVVLRQINATEADAQLFGRLAGSVIYNNPMLRADQDTIIRNKYDQSRLWSYSISGDLPIVLLQIQDTANIDLVKKLIQAHAYWRLKGLVSDLVIWNEDQGGYRQLLQNQILGLIAVGSAADMTDKPGGIFVRAADQIPNEDRILLQSVARVIINDGKGSLEDQINRKNQLKNNIQYIVLTQTQRSHILSSPPLHSDLALFNGYGGFTADGQEYIIKTKTGQKTPLPWVNILANPDFGTVISESGQSYTWSENAHAFRLTPWNNDPVTDLSGEAIYMRDENTGYFWSPSSLPAHGKTPYTTRHGFGYSVFEHSEDGIDTELSVYVDIKDKIKFSVLKIHNRSGRSRRLSATGYVEWVLGDLKNKSGMHIVTEINANGAIVARNPYNMELSERVAFFDVDNVDRSFTTDRTEFIGRNGTLSNPDAMSRVKLSGRTGAAMDACGTIQVYFQLENDATREVIFRTGAGKNIEEAQMVMQAHKGSLAARTALDKVRNYWQQTLTAILIDTPDTSFNILTNGWLMYQALSSRILARSGYYQSGGAYGFRDQLQDVLSVLHTQPSLAHDHILLSASRQFTEGDVQHWWHPPAGRGVRTRCSDDYLWLPFAVSRYVSATGDMKILDELVPYLEGRPLNMHEESYYDLPLKSVVSGTLYEHCIKAIQNGMKYGVHGLPLMGSGDWNDGMDKVGINGQGESVWLGFFLYDILNRFVTIANKKGDHEFEEKYRTEADRLRKNIEEQAWDGQWYRRAYFDDGTPLGSEANEECKIDSISQSWSVLSGAANPERAKTAIENADKILVDQKIGLIKLLDPPFDKSDINPGYIKGYLPGIRENGGQYTHAAVWLIMAHAALGNTKKVWELMTLINPLNHGNSPEKIAVYQVEPYVVAADVYAVYPHSGRGGWTWYSGSAGWMYQLIIEWILGIKLQSDRLYFSPCIPPEWPLCTIRYKHGNSHYLIKMMYQQGEENSIEVTIDDQKQPDNSILLMNDDKEHNVTVTIPNVNHQREVR